MRVRVTVDEWYPTYHPAVAPKPVEGEVETEAVFEVDAKDFRRWKAAFTAFGRAQKEIEEKVDAYWASRSER